MRCSLPLLLVLLGGCAHTGIALNSDGSQRVSSGASVTTSRAGLQVNAGGGVAAALIAGVPIAGTVNDLDNPAPAMDPSRTVSEQDCSKPVAASGNLRCR